MLVKAKGRLVNKVDPENFSEIWSYFVNIWCKNQSPNSLAGVFFLDGGDELELLFG